ncbi:uncharacterized protein LOC115739026 isoform X2 [Rhodamnia argentea]|uniref:Uncharacterized protein LOC115739026 isoform X2 n=1 Tax=Rhodamnia argentea TaxID=178133 RepID=A0ABM3HKZ2_9MYRT|nr:uncharacterized protein LOC115739026 isoform X2 [Rhodamnia argentea]
MVANFNNDGQLPQKGYTENNSATFQSTGNPCLDFFFHVVPDTPPESLTRRLESAWAHDPLTALKLVCNLRGVRGTGKSDKEGFHAAARWLFKNHPRTLACNAGALAGFGYFKDLPEILYRLLEGPDIRARQKCEWLQRKGPKIVRWRLQSRLRCRNQSRRKKGRKTLRAAPQEVRVANAAAHDQELKQKASELRKKRRIAMAGKLLERYKCDGDFRFLHDAVSRHFAHCLTADLEFLKSGEINKISLAAKWCPSLDSSFDLATLLCESIAKRVFPQDRFPEYEGLEEAHYVYRVRDRLRKKALVPLRRVLELPEVYMSAGQWGDIPYNRVASVAMKLNKNKFLKHDGERFQSYLADVKSGKATMAAGALLPHEIVASLEDPDGGEVAELQWKRMVEDLSKEGKLESCIAVCDVSGSMSGTPMDVSVALGLLVSELSREPWKGKVITFSERPQLHAIQGNCLRSKTEFIRRMECGMNTDFQRVFDRILEVATAGKLSAEEMVKKVFVFSDMEFDQASSSNPSPWQPYYGASSSDPWETDYEVITRKFREHGYGAAVPQIVFWNLRDSSSTPVVAKQVGVALVSGFSKNLMKVFLDDEGVISPEALMEAAISGEEYRDLVVVD